MFCGKCGSRIAEGNVFCTTCGTPVTQVTPAPSTQPVAVSVPYATPAATQIKSLEMQPASTTVKVSDTWPWLLATIPMLVSIGLSVTFPSNTTITAIIVVILNIIFTSLDENYLKKKGIQAQSWMWMGIILVPVYLFVRAGKTNKHFAPGIIWCVLFGVDMIISVGNSLASIA